MKKITLGILAHVDSGKTTLSEALLYLSGSLQRQGRVDHRDSFLDNFALERDRGITIFSKQARFTYGETGFTLIDTPGHVDFSAETERALQVLDYAVLVISASDGVQSHTHTLWKLLQKYGVPCFVFINKTDLPGVDRSAVLAELKEKLSDNCIDFGNAGELCENLALCDDALFAAYEQRESLTDAETADAVRRRRVFPCLFGSALRLDGVEALLGLMDRLTVMPTYPQEFSARVFKISDDGGTRLTHMKITGGSLRVRAVLPGEANTQGEKVTQIRLYSGAGFKTADSVSAGEVCTVTGISFAKTGDALGAEKSSFIPVLEPVMTYTLRLPQGVDAHTALAKMRILEAEDPLLRVVWNERFGEIQLQLMGDVQLEVLQSVIRDRFGFEAGFGRGSIIYKETISEPVEGVGHFEPLRHYAEVHLVLKPLPRDSGLVFKTDCREDMLDKNWQRLVLTHLYEKTHLGVLTGSPVTDIEITLVSGRAHAKHTEGGDFRQATYRAVRQGLRCAKSVLLEPVYEYTLEVPHENVGRAMSDIQKMHGFFEPPVIRGDLSVLTGTAPVSKMGDYSAEVVQYTRGRGRLMCSLKGYDVCHNADEVIEKINYYPDNDVENPCDSVFCSHGAGHVVRWNEVKNHMHLPSVLAKPRHDGARESLRAKISRTDDIFALDKELMHIFEQTYGPVKKRAVPEKRRVKAPAAQSSYKRKSAPGYDGTEYVLVDGYNVIFSWEHLKDVAQVSMDGARAALINTLCNYQGFTQCEVIVVFDAYRVPGADRETDRVNGVSIVYTKEAETADMYIEKTSHKLAKTNRVRVVTSDALEQLIILGNGALRVPSQAFLQEIREAEEEIRRIVGLTE